MRDDLPNINLGKAEVTYNSNFFWSMCRDIEIFINNLITKGPITVSTLTVDNIEGGDITINSGVVILRGTGSPEGVVIASVGTIYIRTDSGIIYFKQNGIGNTGWVIAGAVGATVSGLSMTASVGEVRVLTDEGKVLQLLSGVPTWVEPAAKFVAAGSFTGTNVDVDLSTWVAQGFNRFKLMWRDWLPVTNATALCLRFSENGGSSFMATTYSGQYLVSTASSPTTPIAGANATTYAALTGSNSNSGSNSATGWIEFTLGVLRASWVSHTYYVSSGGPAVALLVGSGTCTDIEDGNAIRLYCETSGDHASGIYAIHALKDF